MENKYKVMVTYNHQSDTFKTSQIEEFEGSLAACHSYILKKILSWQDRAIVIKNGNRVVFARRILQHTHYSSMNKFHREYNRKQTVVN